MPYRNPCVICGEPVKGYRYDTKTCSDSCRKRLSRQKDSAHRVLWRVKQSLHELTNLLGHENPDVVKIAKQGIVEIYGSVSVTAATVTNQAGNVTAGSDTQQAGNVTPATVTKMAVLQEAQ